MDMQTISPRAGRGAGSRVFSFSGRGGARGQGALSTSDVSAPEELAGAQQTLKRPALGVNCPHPLEQVLEVPGHIPAHQYLRHPPAAGRAQHAQFFAATIPPLSSAMVKTDQEPWQDTQMVQVSAELDTVGAAR